jgi:hypothetical protein
VREGRGTLSARPTPAGTRLLRAARPVQTQSLTGRALRKRGPWPALSAFSPRRGPPGLGSRGWGPGLLPPFSAPAGPFGTRLASPVVEYRCQPAVTLFGPPLSFPLRQPLPRYGAGPVSSQDAWLARAGAGQSAKCRADSLSSPEFAPGVGLEEPAGDRPRRGLGGTPRPGPDKVYPFAGDDRHQRGRSNVLPRCVEFAPVDTIPPNTGPASGDTNGRCGTGLAQHFRVGREGFPGRTCCSS